MSDRDTPTIDPTSDCRFSRYLKLAEIHVNSINFAPTPLVGLRPTSTRHAANTSVAPLFVHVTIVLAELRASRTRPKSWPRHNSRRRWRVSWAAVWSNEMGPTRARRARSNPRGCPRDLAARGRAATERGAEGALPSPGARRSPYGLRRAEARRGRPTRGGGLECKSSNANEATSDECGTRTRGEAHVRVLAHVN